MACSFLNCSDNESVAEHSPRLVDLREIIHLAVGESWRYRSLWCGSEGCDTTFDATRIIDTISINGKSYFKYYGVSPSLPGYGDTFLERVDSADYSMYICTNCLLHPDEERKEVTDLWLPLHILKTPLERGNHWKIAEWDSTGSMGTLSIVSPDTTFIAGANIFNHAICVAGGDEFSRCMFVIAPGVGVVYGEIAGFDTWGIRELIERGW
jgi:hypothetical protein